MDGARADGVRDAVPQSFRRTKVAVMGMGKSQRPLVIFLLTWEHGDDRSMTWVTNLLHCEFKSSLKT